MGMFDEVYFEADLPPGHPEAVRSFQTKSLSRCLDRLTVTKEGRLILHAFRYESSQEARDIADDTLPLMARMPLLTRIPMGDIDLDFHGDIRLTSTAEGRLDQYVARFTHGILEWIRPWSEISEVHRSVLDRGY